MTSEPITLSESHSKRLRALHHLVPFLSMDELIEELIFVCSPENHLDCIKDGIDKGAERRRIETLIFADEDERFQNWDDLVERAGQVSPYDPANYPEPEPENIVELAPHLHLVR